MEPSKPAALNQNPILTNQFPLKPAAAGIQDVNHLANRSLEV